MYLTHGDRLAKVSPQQFPSRLPTITLDQAAQGQDRLTAGLGPRHTGLLEALSDEGFAGRFHHPAANGQPVADVLSVVHPVSLIAKISQLALQSFSFAPPSTTTMVLQDANDAFGPIVLFFEQYFQTLKLGFAAGVLSPQAASQPSFKWSQAWQKSTISTLG